MTVSSYLFVIEASSCHVLVYLSVPLSSCFAIVLISARNSNYYYYLFDIPVLQDIYRFVRIDNCNPMHVIVGCDKAGREETSSCKCQTLLFGGVDAMNPTKTVAAVVTDVVKTAKSVDQK